MYTIVKGHHIVNLAKPLCIKELPSIVLNDTNSLNNKLLTLNMSIINDNIGALAQGALIEELINNCNLSLGELSKRLGKSKSWLSKRMSLKQNLSDNVKPLLHDNSLHPRTAEEIAKLPKETQEKFAYSVIKEQISKDVVTKLVRLYNDKNTSDETKKRIIDDPLSISLMPPTVPTDKREPNKPQSIDERLNIALGNVKNITSYLERLGARELSPYWKKVELLSKHIDTLNTTLSNLIFEIGRPV